MLVENLVDAYRDWYATHFPSEVKCLYAFTPTYIQVLNERACSHSTCGRDHEPRIWTLIFLPLPSHCRPRNQLYMIALTTLYLYDYLLTFADEVPSPLTIGKGRTAISLHYL